MKTGNYIFTFFLLIIVVACNQKKHVDSSKPNGSDKFGISTDTANYLGVSMINLLATPERYHNRKIYVEGFLHMGFEDNGLYLNETDYKHSITKNSLWVDVSREQANQFAKGQNRFVTIKGTFNSASKGHSELWSGAIKNVVSIDTLITFH